MEDKLKDALVTMSKILGCPTCGFTQVMSCVKEQGYTTFRDVRFFTERGFPLYAMMERKFFMVNVNPVPFSVLCEWGDSGKPMCVKGCISYNDLCAIIVNEVLGEK